MLQGFLEHERGTKMPGQRLSARQQYRYDLLVKAAQDALRRLEQANSHRAVAEAKKPLEAALKEVGEDV